MLIWQKITFLHCIFKEMICYKYRLSATLFLCFIIHLNNGNFTNVDFNFYSFFLETVKTAECYSHLVVINPGNSTSTVNITSPFNYPYLSLTVRLLPGASFTVFIQESHRLDGNEIADKGIMVVGDSGLAVIGYNRQKYQTAGFVVLPETSLGTEYFPVTYCEGVYSCIIGIMAKASGFTNISIQLSSQMDTVLLMEGLSYGKGSTITKQMRFLQTLQLKVTADLTGTKITSDKPVVVFSGNDRSKMFDTGGNVEPMQEMCPPTDFSGTYFIIVNNGIQLTHYVKVVSVLGDNTINVSDNSNSRTFNLTNAGDFSLEVFTSPFVIFSSTHPIHVVHFVQDKKNGKAMYYVQPVCQFQTSYVTYAAENATDDTVTYESYENYIVLVIRNQHRNAVLDNDNLLIPGPNWRKIQDTPYVYSVNPISPGVHRLSSQIDGATFGGYVFGQVLSESYAFPLGFNDKKKCNEDGTRQDKLVKQTHANCSITGGKCVLYELIGRGKLPNASPIDNFKQMSKLSCSAVCSELEDLCSMFSYSSDNNTCYLYKEYVDTFIFMTNVITMFKVQSN